VSLRDLGLSYVLHCQGSPLRSHSERSSVQLVAQSAKAVLHVSPGQTRRENGSWVLVHGLIDKCCQA